MQLKFLLRLFVFISIAICLWFSIIYGFEKIQNKVGLISRNKFIDRDNFDILVLGSSHASAFSTVKTYRNRDFETLACSGGDVKNIQTYLKIIFQNKCKVNTIIYVIDPFSLNTTKFEEWYSLFNDAPLSYSFMKLLIKSDVNFLTIKNYLFSKIHLNVFIRLLKKLTESLIKQNVQLSESEKTENLKSDFKFDSKVYSKERRMRFWYPNGSLLDYDVYHKQCNKLEASIKLIKENKVGEFMFLLPPTLLKEQPAYLKTIEFLDKMEAKYGVKYKDLSHAISDKALFSDHDHLNKNGIEYVLGNFLNKYIDQ